jgi:lipopolysaccharide transport system permease protein
LTAVFETFKVAFLGNGVVDISWLLYSVAFTAVLLTAGVAIFNKVENRFIDTV